MKLPPREAVASCGTSHVEGGGVPTMALLPLHAGQLLLVTCCATMAAWLRSLLTVA
jgi:hypothetical protein